MRCLQTQRGDWTNLDHTSHFSVANENISSILWLADGKYISVKGAPTRWGAIS